MFYDDSGVESARFALDPPSGRYCVHIPAGQWHTLEVLKSGSVIFEVKHGPYTPFEPEDILYWPGLSVKGIAWYDSMADAICRVIFLCNKSGSIPPVFFVSISLIILNMYLN